MAQAFKPEIQHHNRAHLELVEKGNLAGLMLHAVVPGEREVYPAELTLAAPEAPATTTSGLVTLEDPVRTVAFYATGSGVYVARTAASAGVQASGEQGDRVFIPAGVPIELPWYWDEVHVVAPAAAVLHVIGKV